MNFSFIMAPFLFRMGPGKAIGMRKGKRKGMRARLRMTTRKMKMMSACSGAEEIVEWGMHPAFSVRVLEIRRMLIYEVLQYGVHSEGME